MMMPQPSNFHDKKVALSPNYFGYWTFLVAKKISTEYLCNIVTTIIMLPSDLCSSKFFEVLSSIRDASTLIAGKSFPSWELFAFVCKGKREIFAKDRSIKPGTELVRNFPFRAPTVHIITAYLSSGIIK